MAENSFRHSEAFLQWIWENLLFDFSALKTTCGKEVQIYEQGILNTSDGPDFKHAVVGIEGLRWHGDIEIHTKSSHWKAHGHQHNAEFNTVVLHVVAEDNPQQVFTQNGSAPLTLNLLPCLSRELHLFLKSFDRPENLPCSSGLHFISEEAFYQQLERAHTEYFEKKADDFLRYYNPGLIPSKAWKHALIISLWDGLGISHNREPMRKTAEKLLTCWDGKNVEKGIENAFKAAGFRDAVSEANWNYKSVRPANHPRQRIPEAVRLTSQIMEQPFGELLTPRSVELWQNWLAESALKNTSRFQILFGTVYLPSLYVLGNLFAATPLKRAALESWKNLKTPIPSSLLTKFRELGISDKSYRKKLGAIHQMKAYCKPGKCSKCFVLKKAIES